MTALCFLWGLAASAADIDKLTIYIPGAEGGGFDRTGLVIREVLISEGIVANVEIVRSSGAGGLIGLAQFLENRQGDPYAVFLGGRTNIGAKIFNRSEISLQQTQPIARLNSTAIVLAVPAISKIENFDQLLDLLSVNPSLIKWVGGSVGSQDELLMLELAHEFSINREALVYQAFPGGGSVIVDHLLAGHAHVGLSSYEEFKDAAQQGKLRIIATSAPERLSSYGAPSLSEYSSDFVFSDWRGIFAPPGLSEQETKALDTLFMKLNDSPGWKNALAQNEWRDVYLSGEDFETFINDEVVYIQNLLNSNPTFSASSDPLSKFLSSRYKNLVLSFGIIGLLLAVLFMQRYFNRRREDNLQASLLSAEEELQKKLSGAKGHIDTEFESWKLTESENEIGWLLLKGLSFKEIAEARGTSERTVRQQARSIYAKSGLSNRSDLAAYFFEDFVFGKTA